MNIVVAGDGGCCAVVDICTAQHHHPLPIEQSYCECFD